LRVVAEHRPTHVFGMPTMPRRVAALASTVDTSSVCAVVSNGDVLTPGTSVAARSAFGCPVINIYGSSEVERALDGHPGMAEVACAPVPDPDLGERLCTCVAARPGRSAPSLGQLTAFLLERGLGRRKLPERQVVLPELPLGRAGKVCLATVTRLAAERQGVDRQGVDALGLPGRRGLRSAARGRDGGFSGFSGEVVVNETRSVRRAGGSRRWGSWPRR
jgi:acyl-coenzyme A synthetase/AMP-(fatty) acid ligase